MKRPPGADAAKSDTETSEVSQPPRSVAEIHWLLLILLAFYLAVPGTPLEASRVVAYALAGYLGFVLVLRAAGRRRPDSGVKLLVQVWAMIALITVVSWYSGKQDSALLNLYLLPLIASAVSLERWANAVQVALVLVCYVLLAAGGGAELASLAWGSRLLVEIAPLVLVAFMLARLAGEVRLGRQRIQTLSETDDLTGLWNMRAFNRMHRREHQRAERHQRPYSLMMLDMNNLKHINDTHGHDAGDRAIKAVSRALARVTRVTDVVARFGGDEFVVLLQEADRHMATEVAARMRKILARTEIELEGETLPASASIGHASYPLDGNEPKHLLALADRRMYEDKRRNQAVGERRDAASPSTG